MVAMETIRFSEAQERLEELIEVGKEVIKKNKQRLNDLKPGEEETSPDEEEVKEELKIDVEKHLEEPEISLKNTDPNAIINNPFTGEIDEESVTPSPVKSKKMKQMKGRAVSLGGNRISDPKGQLHHFEQFAKLVQIEE